MVGLEEVEEKLGRRWTWHVFLCGEFLAGGLEAIEAEAAQTPRNLTVNLQIRVGGEDFSSE